jgi:threonine dehydrogenase-like Zn-dependent dehydrogenase
LKYVTDDAVKKIMSETKDGVDVAIKAVGMPALSTSASKLFVLEDILQTLSLQSNV